MGETKPTTSVRPRDMLRAWCRSRGVKIMNKSIGESPMWPEDFRSARRRFAERFLTFLHRGFKAKRNFLLVSHADCVGAALSVMPSMANKLVESVEYGGHFLATCRHAEYALTTGKLPRGGTFPGASSSSGPAVFGSEPGGFTGAMPSAPTSPALPALNLVRSIQNVRQLPRLPEVPQSLLPDIACSPRRTSCPDAWAPGSPDGRTTPKTGTASPYTTKDTHFSTGDMFPSTGDMESEAEMWRCETDQVLVWMDDANDGHKVQLRQDGWTLEIHNIKTVNNPGKKESSTSFAKRVQQLGRTTKYSVPQIERLLLNLSDSPLGVGDSPLGVGDDLADLQGVGVQGTSSLNNGAPMRSTTTHGSCTSVSTYLFGMSDGAGSDVCSDDEVPGAEVPSRSASDDMTSPKRTPKRTKSQPFERVERKAGTRTGCDRRVTKSLTACDGNARTSRCEAVSIPGQPTKSLTSCDGNVRTSRCETLSIPGQPVSPMARKDPGESLLMRRRGANLRMLSVVAAKTSPRGPSQVSLLT